MIESASNRNCILNITIADRQSFLRCWIPFFKNGGLFIISIKKPEMDSGVFVLLKLFDDESIWPLYCKVAVVISNSNSNSNSNRIRNNNYQSVSDVEGCSEGFGLQIVSTDAALMDKLQRLADADAGSEGDDLKEGRVNSVVW